jgi:hypothetical protein
MIRAYLAQLLGKLLCNFFGHRRGKRMHDDYQNRPGFLFYECPRCGAQWTRKVKVKP